jgi:hypothetical protein
MTAPSIFTQQHRLSILIHAGSKIGKSTLTGTSPKPILVLDAEGSWRFIPLRQYIWDPMMGPPPVYDGTWDACVVNVREWSTVDQVYRWLTQYESPFASVIVDSITEIQRRCKANLVGTDALKIQDWGVLLAVMDGVIRGFRDLTLMQTNVRCVVFVAETRQRNSDNKFVPYMQGQIAVSLPYWVDICGYLYPAYELDANGQATREYRELLITPHPQFEAGERVQGRLGKSIAIYQPGDGTAGTDIEDWMKKIYGLDQVAPATVEPQPVTQ